MKIIYTYHENSNIWSDHQQWHNDIELYKLYQEISFLFTRKSHPNTPIVLKTNTAGWKTVKELELPWDNVDICLDSFDHLESNFWPYIKSKSLFEEKPPFIHIDYDVILEKNILDIIKPYKVIYQSPEPLINKYHYETFIKVYKKNISPTFLAYNGGFTYINADTSKVNDALDAYFDKYSGLHEDEFLNGMGVEQIIIPDILKKENKTGFTTLAYINSTSTNIDTEESLLKKYDALPGINYPSLGYTHYIWNSKYHFIDQVQKILKDIKNETLCLS